jgi:hypothetical protein
MLSNIEADLAADSRTALFDYQLVESDEGITISGETNIPEIIKAINDSLSNGKYSIKNRLQLLPSKELGEQKWALVNVSVGNIRSEPGHSSELVNQSTGGSPLNVLKKSGSWFLVQTPEKYIGWIDGGAITRIDENTLVSFLENEKVIFTGVYGFSLVAPQKEAASISDIVGGNIFRLIEESNSYWEVVYPDGRKAFLDKANAEIYSLWLLKQKYDYKELINIAFQLNGVPYLWGGTSTKGLDCSGFTKTIYFMNGILLPRDASQQELIGSLIDDRGDFQILQPGDLLFFGHAATDSTAEKVVHVSMWIGEMEFIHASGDVHIGSMDPASPIFDDYNRQRYLSTRRILGSDDFNDLLVQNFFGEGLHDQ